MIFSIEMLILLICVLVVCILGFKKYIWFISIGYGLSITAISFSLLIMHYSNLDLITIISLIIVGLYGIRLGGYLAYREIKTSYNKRMKGEISDGKNMSLFVKSMLWLSCALLYLMMMMPLIIRVFKNSSYDNFLIIGISITLFGIIIEALSDAQKSSSKKKNPNRFCSSGLFKIVRCPNYLGELIIWTGVFISGISILNTPLEWVLSILGYLGIVYIMFSGCRRLEIRQDKNYGEDKEYIKYKSQTPIILPLIPLYSVKKHKWLVG